MATKQVTNAFRTSLEDKHYIDQDFEASGASSRGEYYVGLVNFKNAQPEAPATIEVERIVEVARKHDTNEISLILSPAQMFALRNTVLSTSDFAQEQNRVIDNLSTGKRPFMYFGSLFEPEFQSLWIRNKVVTDKTPAEEKEAAIKFNMSAFLLNMFFTNLIEGRISESLVTAETLQSFIKRQAVITKPIVTPGSKPDFKKIPL